MPASGAEAAAWTVRGWADVAVGCLALDGPAAPADRAGFASRPAGPDRCRAFVGPDRCGGFAGPDRCGAAAGPDLCSACAGPGRSGAFAGLDEVIQSVPVASGGQHAARLRRLRRFAGPVPPCYPDTRPVDGPIRSVRSAAWRAADHLAGFGERLMMTATRLLWDRPCPLCSERQLAWGVRYRPSPSDAHVTLALPVDRWLARRTWMCLPGWLGPSASGPRAAVAEVPSTATPLAQQVWRGIHEGAHLDHLSALSRSGAVAPSPAEFGAGLLAAESYAMAVEILAAVECLLAGEGAAIWQLGAGLVERATRLPGGSDPAPEFTDLPTLAEVYVLGPLEILAGGSVARPGGSSAPAGDSVAQPGGSSAPAGGSLALAGGSVAHPGGSLALAGGSLARADGPASLAGRPLALANGSLAPADSPPAHALPADLIGALQARWRAACAAYPPAAAFGGAAAEVLSRSPGAGSAFLAIEMSGLSNRDARPNPARYLSK